jgi:DNA polymerase-3 subunit epsilon
MRILSLDFETSWTTPVNPKQARIFEVGAVLYDTAAKSPVKILSEFVFEQEHPISPKELVDLTGITDDMRKQWGIRLSTCLILLNRMLTDCDYVIAHNGNDFDRPLLYAEAERIGYPVLSKPWIDSKLDIDFPPQVQSRKLTHLCAEMGFVNPFSHRAVFDALSVLKLLEKFNIDDVVASSLKPNCQVIASVSYDKKHLAKERGYYWNGEEKYWWKAMKLDKAEKEKAEAPFSVQIRQV